MAPGNPVSSTGKQGFELKPPLSKPVHYNTLAPAIRFALQFCYQKTVVCGEGMIHPIGPHVACCAFLQSEFQAEVVINEPVQVYSPNNANAFHNRRRNPSGFQKVTAIFKV